MTWSCWCELQLPLRQFATKCEAAGVRINTSESEAMVLGWKNVDCQLQVREELQPQMEEFKYQGVLLRCEGKVE